MGLEIETEGDKANVVVKFGWLGAGIYIALGILYHLIMGDYEVFSWGDPWLYASMFLWPFFLLGWIIVWGIGIAVVCFLAYWLFVDLPEQRQRKRVAAERRAAYEKERAERAERLEEARREAARNA